MRELASSSLTDGFLRRLFLQRLPAEMQSILSVSSESLDNLPKMADKIAEVRTDSVSGAAYSIGGRCRGELSSDSPLNEMAALRAQTASLSQQSERLSRARSRDRSRSGYFKSPRRNNEYKSNRELCFYHPKLGIKARKFRDTCSFPKNNPEN